MDFGHDTSCALATVVDLVNTAPGRSPGDEALADLAPLRGAGGPPRDLRGRLALTDDDLAAVRRLRARLHAVFAAADEPTPSGWSTPWSPTPAPPRG